MKVMLLANWGIGLEIIKALDQIPNVEIAFVGSNFDPLSKDQWHNVVYLYAKERRYKTVSLHTLSHSDMIQAIKINKIDLLITHAYMKILPREVFESPVCGAINIHMSLLPLYRGASPTYWVLKKKDPITGMTAHYIAEKMDAGDIIEQIAVPVLQTDTIETVIERQKEYIGELMNNTLIKVKNKTFRPFKQQSHMATYAPKPKEK